MSLDSLDYDLPDNEISLLDMHWHTMKRLETFKSYQLSHDQARSPKQHGDLALRSHTCSTADGHRIPLKNYNETSTIFVDAKDQQVQQERSVVEFGHDDATDLPLSEEAKSMPIWRTTTSSEVAEPRRAAKSVITVTDWNDWRKVPIPRHSNGLTTYAYQQALRNCISSLDLRCGSIFDFTTYTPIFIYDCLMLPGSLANVLDEKHTVPSCIARMTPAILPAFHAHIRPDSHMPDIQPAGQRNAFVRGMLLFGLGHSSRRYLKAHYHRIGDSIMQANVLFDVVDEVPWLRRVPPPTQIGPVRRMLVADVFVGQHCAIETSRDQGLVSCESGKSWTLEDYLAGTLEGAPTPEPLDVDSRRTVDSTTWQGGSEREAEASALSSYWTEAMCNSAPAGDIEYEVGEGFTGW